MVDIVRDMVSSNFLSGSSPLTNQRSIQLAKFLPECSNIFNNIKDVDWEKFGAMMLGISYRDDENVFSSWTENGPLLVRATSQYARNAT